MESGTESSKRDQDKAAIADLIGAVVECWNRTTCGLLRTFARPTSTPGPDSDPARQLEAGLLSAVMGFGSEST